MGYDCHLEICGQTPGAEVQQRLERCKPSGVVYVQKRTDARSRDAWMARVDGRRGACGVARVNVCDVRNGFAELAVGGVCGALLVAEEAVPPARQLEEVQRLHEVLPGHWHMELMMSWGLASRLCSQLARMHRTFCLTPVSVRSAVSELAERRLLWWFDMGNAYLKLTAHPVGVSDFRMGRLVCRHVPDRVVFGGTGSDLSLVEPDMADRNARRLYPFFLTHTVH